MNNVIKRVWKQGKMVTIESLNGMTFQDESNGHTFAISAVDENGNAVSLAGTPTGNLLRADNQDVALTCSVANGVVYATLPANAYSVPGRFAITVFLTSDGQTTAIFAAIGIVSRTDSGEIAPPAGSNVTSLVNAINTAVGNIPVNFNAAFAPAYSDSGLYSVGQYVTCNGTLYRCITPVTISGTWSTNSSKFTAATLGNDVYDLKSALNSDEQQLYNLYKKGNFYSETLALQGKDIVTATGKIIDGENYKVSAPIVMDFTKNLWDSGLYNHYVYCYGDNDIYYGRVQINNYPRILNVYPDTKYIRVLASITTQDIVVAYYEYRDDAEIFNPVDGWIEQSQYLAEKLSEQNEKNDQIDSNIEALGNEFTYEATNTGYVFFTKKGRVSCASNVQSLTPETNSNCEYIIKNVVPGEKYAIHGYTNGAYYAWAIFNDDGTTLNRVDHSGNGEVEEVVKIPANSNRLVVNTDIRDLAVGKNYCYKVDYVFSNGGTTENKIENAVQALLKSNSNFFNRNDIIQDKTPASATGIMQDDTGYWTSHKIVMDFTKKIIITNGSYNYAYCYGNDSYYGRINCKDGVVIADTYPDTAYICIVGADADKDVMVTYGTVGAYKPYTPIDGYIDESPKCNPVSIRVAQYNMGDFSGNNMTAGSDEVKAAMISAISEVNANIWGLQYDTEHFGAEADIYNSILQMKKYYKKYYSGSYNGKGILSDYPIYNTKRILYDMNPVAHPWFYVADVMIEGKLIKIITLHVDWQDITRRRTQLQKVRDYADLSEYVIITGDFNPEDYINGEKQSDDMTTLDDLAVFTQDGKYAISNAGFFGDFKTFVHHSWPGMWNGDNILVSSSNITINKVTNYQKEYMNDHTIFCADITIY